MLRYELISGNERKLFSLDPFNGTLYLEKEIDLDAESGLSGTYAYFGTSLVVLF